MKKTKEKVFCEECKFFTHDDYARVWCAKEIPISTPIYRRKLHTIYDYSKQNKNNNCKYFEVK